MIEATGLDRRVLTLIYINIIIRAVLQAPPKREKPSVDVHDITNDGAWQSISRRVNITGKEPLDLLRGIFHVHMVSFFCPSTHRRVRPPNDPGRDWTAIEQHMAASAMLRDTNQKVFRYIFC